MSSHFHDENFKAAEEIAISTLNFLGTTKSDGFLQKNPSGDFAISTDYICDDTFIRKDLLKFSNLEPCTSLFNDNSQEIGNKNLKLPSNDESNKFIDNFFSQTSIPNNDDTLVSNAHDTGENNSDGMTSDLELTIKLSEDQLQELIDKNVDKDVNIPLSIKFIRKTLIPDVEGDVNYIKTNFGGDDVQITFLCDICDAQYKTLDAMYSVQCSSCNKCYDYCKFHENVCVCPFCLK